MSPWDYLILVVSPSHWKASAVTKFAYQCRATDASSFLAASVKCRPAFLKLAFFASCHEQAFFSP